MPKSDAGSVGLSLGGGPQWPGAGKLESPRQYLCCQNQYLQLQALTGYRSHCLDLILSVIVSRSSNQSIDQPISFSQFFYSISQ